MEEPSGIVVGPLADTCGQGTVVISDQVVPAGGEGGGEGEEVIEQQLYCD